MLPELIVKFRPNNQISLTLQNSVAKIKEIYQANLPDNFTDSSLSSAHKAKEKLRLAWYRFRNAPVSAPLDIIRKSQRKLKGRLLGNPVKVESPNFWLARLQTRLRMQCCYVLGSKIFLYIIDWLCFKGEYRLNSPKRFTSISGQKLLESGAIIEMLCGDRPEFSHCTTLTLPANHRDAFECLAAWSGYAVNRLFQYLRRHYPDMNLYFFVWEFQKRGALHLHICHYHPDSAEGQLIGFQLCELWHRILCDISEESGICMFSRADRKSCTIRQNHQHHTQPMIKGCGRYFAKYAIKNGKDDADSYVKEYAKTLSPTRFWGSSMAIKNLIKQFSLELRTYNLDGSSQSKMDEIEQEILLMEVIQYRQDEWKIEIDSPDGRFGNQRLTVNEGVRKTFYLSPKDYLELLLRYGEIAP
jgi:hypothetical protein